MTPEILRNAGNIYDEVSGLPREARDGVIRERCAGNGALEEAVRRLIRAAEQEEAVNRATLAAVGAGQGAGRQFGQFRATGVVGQGGMGIVYEAERADGQFVQRAAVKVVSGATATAETNLRFLMERQILANLQHPNIARLLDGGVTPEGEPFLVMEYVDGEPIDRWCDGRKLPVEARIELFLKVIQAVDFAHRQLVVHRDIKPGNILVDSAGEPHLLDFGTAKMLGGEHLSKTQQYLTPRYASPEQLRSEPASVAMDVYSLGVTLYELLTGRWPFGEPSEPDVNFARVVGHVRASEPSSVTSQAAAEVRGVSEGVLREQLGGDLRFILLRALEADPAQRYGTAKEFGEDLERYRGGYPVQARKGTTGYLVRRWLGRNRWVTVAAGLVLVTAAVAIGLREQQRRLVVQRELDLRALGRYQLFDLQDRMAFYGVPLAVRREAASRSLEALDRIQPSQMPDASFRAELAESYARLAEIFGNPLRANLGRVEEANRALERASQLAASLPDTPAYAQARLAVSLQRSMFEFTTAKGAETLPKTRQLVLEWQKRIRPEEDPPADVARVAAIMTTVVNVARNAGGAILDDSIWAEDVRTANALVEAALRRDPRNPYALQTRYQIRKAEAETLAEKDTEKGVKALLAVAAEIDAQPPALASASALRFQKAQILDGAGWFLGQGKRYDEAIANLKAAIAIYERIAEADPARMNVYMDLSGCYRALGFVNEYAGRWKDAVEALRKAIAGYEVILSNTSSEGMKMMRGELLIRVAGDLQQMGTNEEARKASDEGIRTLVELASRPKATIVQLRMAARYLLEPPFPGQRDPQRALELARRAVAAAPNSGMVLETLSLAAEQSGNLDEALEAARKRLDVTPESSPGRGKALERVKQIEAKLGSKTGAIPPR